MYNQITESLYHYQKKIILLKWNILNFKYKVLSFEKTILLRLLLRMPAQRTCSSCSSLLARSVQQPTARISAMVGPDWAAG